MKNKKILLFLKSSIWIIINMLLTGGYMNKNSGEPINELRTDLLIWVDLETTGLDVADNMHGVHKNKILEVGMHITDKDFNIIDKGFEIVIYHREKDLLPLMNDYVIDMHTKSGLLEKVKQSPYDLKTAQQMMVDYVKSFNIKPGSSPICGNNVSFDKNFLDAQMPEFAKLLHYRKIDVSSFKEVVTRLYPEVAAQLDKPYKHRGLDDIQESIKELKFYQAHIFAPQAAEPEVSNSRKMKP